MVKVWLITGSGNGLGRDIAEAALAAGDSLVDCVAPPRMGRFTPGSKRGMKLQHPQHRVYKTR
jgi:NAD(P)-dependent dehydrogenase (short-subunit alcohol dehydrogenase family)